MNRHFAALSALAAVFVCFALLSGCGGGGEASGKEPKASSTASPSSESPTETPTPTPPLEAINDITDDEVIELNEICSASGVAGYGDAQINDWINRFRQLSQYAVDNLRFTIEQLDQRDEPYRIETCEGVSSAVLNAANS